jgi:hypothetical protein
MNTDPANRDDGSSKQSWMDESKWEYLLKNWGLILTVAKKWRESKGGHTVEWDDIVHGALLLACVCMKTWDPEKSKFSTYYFQASTHQERYLHRGLFKEHTEKNGYTQVHSIDRPGDHNNDDDGDIKDTIASEDDLIEIIESRDEAKRLAFAVAKLPDHLQSHALDILNDRVNWSDVATTRDLHNKTLEALREEML